MNENEVEKLHFQLATIARKLFKFVDIFVDEDDRVIGIVMTNSEAYLGYVSNYEDIKNQPDI